MQITSSNAYFKISSYHFSSVIIISYINLQKTNILFATVYHQIFPSSFYIYWFSSVLLDSTFGIFQDVKQFPAVILYLISFFH